MRRDVDTKWTPDAVGAAREPTFLAGKKVEQKGFEPSTPTLRTWCSPN